MIQRLYYDNYYDNVLYEKIKEIQHEIWADWMKYLFSVGFYHPIECKEEPIYAIPYEFHRSWTRKIETKYSDLSEREKKGFREPAQKIMDVLEEFTGDRSVLLYGWICPKCLSTHAPYVRQCISCEAIKNRPIKR